MTVQNTDTAPVLLYTTIENIAEDQEELVVATPAHGAAGGRSVPAGALHADQEGTAGHAAPQARVLRGHSFARGADNQVQTTFRQNIPMIIQPRSLEKLKDPWTRLTATVDGDRLRLCNDSAYVVRLAQQARLTAAYRRAAAQDLPAAGRAPGAARQGQAGRRRHGHDLAGHGLRLCRGHPRNHLVGACKPTPGNEAARTRRRAWLRFSA